MNRIKRTVNNIIIRSSINNKKITPGKIRKVLLKKKIIYKGSKQDEKNWNYMNNIIYNEKHKHLLKKHYMCLSILDDLINNNVSYSFAQDVYNLVKQIVLPEHLKIYEKTIKQKFTTNI